MAQSVQATPPAETYKRIAPSKGWSPLNLSELWKYRQLLYYLVWRDIKVRYTQTLLGVSWALIQPLLTMVVFTIFFGGLAKVPSDGIPYPLFSYVALVPWTFFANGLQQATTSMVSNAGMITKIYFPRLLIPLAAVLAGFMDFVVAFVVLVGMILIFRTPTTSTNVWAPFFVNQIAGSPASWGITSNVIWLPFFILLAFAAALGVGLWLSALNVVYRDVRYIVPFAIQIWLFATPIAYSSSLLKEPWHTLYGLNPMAGVIEGFRWAMLGTNTAPGPILAISVITTLIVLVSGAFYFRRMERSFADVV